LAPTASCTASPTTGAPPLDVSVDALASYDVDGSIASYSWNWGDGSTASAGATATHTYATAGAYIITLTVTDNLGATGTATQSIVASTGNLPPSAHVENFTVAGLGVTFEGHGHDDANGLTHAWNFGDGTPVATLTGQLSDVNSTVIHAYAAAGTYTCTLTVTDAGGLTAAHTASVVVAAASSGGGGGGGGGGGCGLVGWEAVILFFVLRRRTCSR
jgi:PKD repeat protein